MKRAPKDRKMPVVHPSIPASLASRCASPADQKTWTEADRARRTCMHCKTAYKAGSGGAYVCEQWHEGLL